MHRATIKKDRLCMYSVTFRHVHAAIVEVEMQEVFHIMSVCLCSCLGYLTRKLHHFCVALYFLWGYAVAQLVEALRHKPEGRGFDSRWFHWNFSLK